jgi:hypothetical protein
MEKLNPDRLTTIFALIAGVIEVLMEFEYVDKRIGGLCLGLCLVFWGALTNKTTHKNKVMHEGRASK